MLPFLAGLDDIAWASLEHAYGPADDVPDLLRALAGGDEEQAEAAVYELYGTIWHQGSVYPATIPAVPLLVDLAVSGAAGSQTPEILRLLGHIAGSTDPRGIEDPDAVRSAVAARAGDIAALLGHADARTRAAVLFVLVNAAAQDVRALALERWHAESEGLPRAEALHALLRVDASTAADVADGVLSPVAFLDGADAAGRAVLRVSAALAWISAGRPMDERVLDAALTPMPTDAGLWYWNDEGELFDQIMTALLARQGVQAAIDVLAEALKRAPRAPVEDAERYLARARWLIVSYRSAAAALVEPITRLLGRAEVAGRVIGLLEVIGARVAGPGARERLVELADAGVADGAADPSAAGLAAADPGAAIGLAAADPGAAIGLAAEDRFAAAGLAAADPVATAGLAVAADPSTLAEQALTCLARWQDPVVPDILSRTLADRPRTLEVVAASAATLPFHPGLLAAIRLRLTELCDAPPQQPAAADNPFAAVQGRSEPVHLAKILTAWAGLAAPAVPELVRLLATRPIVVAPALAAIRPQSPECIAALRRVAATADGRDAVRARIAAAQAVRTLTQDESPLLAAVRVGLTIPTDSPDPRAVAAEAAADLAGHAGALVPLLLQALQDIAVPTPSLPAHQARMQLGRALWLLTDRPDHAIDVLRGTLGLAGEMFTSWTVADAADLAAELGPAARELVPHLEAALDDPISCPAAAHALLTIDPDGPWSGPRREELAEHLVHALEHSRMPVPRNRALDVLAGLTPLPSSAAEKLRAFAERDERAPDGIQDGENLRNDEELQERIKTMLDQRKREDGHPLADR